MSRMTLCLVTAAVLIAGAVTVMCLRYLVLGAEAAIPAGPNTYHVTIVARGKAGPDARLTLACPLECHRQHIFNEEFRSNEFTHRPLESKQEERRLVQWLPSGSGQNISFQIRYEFFCTVNVAHPTAPMERLGRHLYAAPKTGEYIQAEARIDPHHPMINELALEVVGGLHRPQDQARALFSHVDQIIANDPGAGGPGASAVECLQAGRGDAAAKSRLLAALLRNRGIPARLVTGLLLKQRDQQLGHVWVEAWVGDQWLAFCPFHHHCGRVPGSYLVTGFGDAPLIRGQNVRGLTWSCLVEQRTPAQIAPANSSWLRTVFERTSLHRIPPSERSLVEFLLLLPLAALLICIFRNVIGIQTFGTFAPALIGLAFRQFESLPGILVFVCIILVGWGMRRLLDRYHLLQVPRSAFLLSLVIVILLGAIITANSFDLVPTRYFSLFPLVILTGMIERFWTLETEDGTASSFRTLVSTMFVAATISLCLSPSALVHHLFRYPETLGIVMAFQLLLGRYTGYRLSELLRFRDFLRSQGLIGPVQVSQDRVSVPARGFGGRLGERL